MGRAKNDSTLSKLGDIYQYYVALLDCFSLQVGDKIEIELNGDVSLISVQSERSFQKEVKHHLGNKNLTERDIDLWKTLANWYSEFDRIENFHRLILFTTANISSKSPFSNWNSFNVFEKFSKLKDIGKEKKTREKKFREAYDAIFADETYDEEKLLKIIAKFDIIHKQKQVDGISKEFDRFLTLVPKENRDHLIAALLGEILSIVKVPPHKWIIPQEEFGKILQLLASKFILPGKKPLPSEFAEVKITEAEAAPLRKKNFILAIQQIEYDSQISFAVLDYWKTILTIAKYFEHDILYTKSIDPYRIDIKERLNFTKQAKMLNVVDTDYKNQIKNSQIMYNEVMGWPAANFGSIVDNRGYFQRGIIHTIVDEKDFSWNLGDQNEL